MKSVITKSLLGAAAIGALGLGFMPSSASALEIADFMYQKTLWNDQSAESLGIDQGPSAGCPTCAFGQLDVGDTLRGIIAITTTNNQGPGGGLHIPGITNNEITAVFETQVKTKTALLDSGGNPVLVPGIGLPAYNFTFEPVGGTNGTGFVAPGVSGVAGAMVAFYFDHDASTNTFQLNGSTCTTTGPGGNCEGNASDDKLVLVLGQGSDPDYMWHADAASDQVALATEVSTANGLGSGFTAYLQVLQNFTGKGFDPIAEGADADNFDGGDNKIDVVASGALTGSCNSNTLPNPCPDPATPYQATDSTNFHFQAIPEPATLTILGASLFGLGIVSRRRRK